jgi:PAS domain S-box-containing protein
VEKKTLRLLILEDRSEDAELVVHELEKDGFNIAYNRSDTENGYRKGLAEKPDLILADYNLPTFDGMSALLIQKELTPDIPFIIVSGTVGEEIAVECLKAGATDYILKDRLFRLGPVVKRALEATELQCKRKKIEDQLRLLSSAVEQSSEGIAVVDLKGRLLFLNNAFAAIHGYNTEELIGRYLSVFHTPEQMASVDSANRQIRESGKFKGEIWHVRQDGTVFPTLMNNSLLRDGNGKPIGIIGTVRDITDRKKAEEALKQSEERYRVLIQSMEALIFSVDRDGLFHKAGGRRLERMGLSPDDVVGKTLFDIFPEAEAKQYRKLFQKVFESGEVCSYEYEGEYSGKKTIDQTNIYPIHNAHGDIELVGVICRDITEQRFLEGQLGEVQRMETVGQLAGGVAHDFNNLIMAIQGYTELALMEVQESDSLYEDLNEIQKAAKNAAGLTRQLLLFSRRQPIEFGPLDLNGVIADLSKMLNRLLGEDISLITEPASNLKSVRGDSGTVQQVIMNIVVNARDAMPEGGKITIKTENAHVNQEYCRKYSYAYPGNFVKFEIADTGMGMDPEVAGHIFEPFYTTKGIGKGTGLGLSVVYGIVKQHKGWINVESSPGKGTIFSIYLPEFPQEAGLMQETSVSPDTKRGKGERILLVEDEKAVRDLSNRVLSNNGYLVFPASDAKEAHEIFKSEEGNFDLILSDVVLPDESGLELVEKFLRLKPGIKALFVSGYSDEKSGWHIIQQRGFPYLQKPYPLSDFLKAVSRELGKKR